MINIYFEPSEKQMYAEGFYICQQCRTEITEQMFFKCYWGKKSRIETYCIKCFDKFNDHYSVVDECYPVILDIIPETAIPILLQPPQLANKNGFTIFEVGNILKNSEAQIIDHTRLAGRIDRNAMLEVQKNKELLDNRNIELNSKPDVNVFFSNLKNSELITHDKKRLLEQK